MKLTKRLAAVSAVFVLASCGQDEPAQTTGTEDAAAMETATPAPEAIPMGTNNRSITSFFVTSVGSGEGGNLGGLEGADAHCQALATAAGAGDRTWRAYLSVTDLNGKGAIHARDRIGTGPWYNAKGVRIARNVDDLHSDSANVNSATALTEKGEVLPTRPNVHDVITGSMPDGRAWDCRECQTRRPVHGDRNRRDEVLAAVSANLSPRSNVEHRLIRVRVACGI